MIQMLVNKVDKLKNLINFYKNVYTSLYLLRTCTALVLVAFITCMVDCKSLLYICFN